MNGKGVISPAALEEIQSLPLVIQRRVQEIVERLANWPNVSGAKPLKGNLSGHYRIRTGDYRVQFYRKDGGKTLVVEKVGHRDGFYDE